MCSGEKDYKQVLLKFCYFTKSISLVTSCARRNREPSVQALNKVQRATVIPVWSRGLSLSGTLSWVIMAYEWSTSEITGGSLFHNCVKQETKELKHFWNMENLRLNLISVQTLGATSAKQNVSYCLESFSNAAQTKYNGKNMITELHNPVKPISQCKLLCISNIDMTSVGFLCSSVCISYLQSFKTSDTHKQLHWSRFLIFIQWLDFHLSCLSHLLNNSPLHDFSPIWAIICS